jgi:hypothetical protein
MKPERGVASILFFTLSALARIGRAVRWASLQRLCLPECRFSLPSLERRRKVCNNLQHFDCVTVRFLDKLTKPLKTLFYVVFMRSSRKFALLSRKPVTYL